MKELKILCFLLFSINTFFAQKAKEVDIWSGRYRMEPLEKKDNTPSEVMYTIKKLSDANPDNLAGRYQDDLKRWIMIRVGKPKEKVNLRRFLFNSENNEYDEFGWTELHKQGKINCMQGARFFICKTQKNKTLNIGGDENLFTKSGFFGVLLHYGAFELYKVN